MTANIGGGNDKLKSEDSFGDFVRFVGTVIGAVGIEFAPTFAGTAAYPNIHRRPLEHGIHAFKAFQDFGQDILGRFAFD
jgi:hypothetical protein